MLTNASVTLPSNLLTTTISTSTALVTLGSATTTRIATTEKTTTAVTATVCQDGLFTADDGKCYACYRGSFDAATVTCSCDKKKNFVSNAAGDGCDCAEGYLINKVNDVCIMCSGIGAFVNDAGLCLCGTGATLIVVDNLLQCVCQVNWVQSGDSCLKCDGGKIYRTKHLLKVIGLLVNDVCTCDSNLNLTLNVDGTGCECENGFLFYDGSCIACQGLSAALVNGVCTCGPKERLDNGVCVCLDDDYMITSQNTCVRCYGIGAVLENDICTCNDVDGTQFDLFLDGKCICEPKLYTVSINGSFI